MAQEALTLKKEIEMGIDSYAVRNLDGIGETYVYETDSARLHHPSKHHCHIHLSRKRMFLQYHLLTILEE